MGLGETLVVAVVDDLLHRRRAMRPRTSFRAILDLEPRRPGVQLAGGRCLRH
jgi:hypothetical protein